MTINKYVITWMRVRFRRKMKFKVNSCNFKWARAISSSVYNDTLLVMCSVSTNGERASIASLKLTIGSLLECS